VTITPEYTESLKKLHERKTFGIRTTIPSEVIRCITEYNIQSILDFGCGKGNVVTELKKMFPNLIVYGYDPAQEEFNSLPSNVDMIFSTDVLEHVEPHLLDKTLLELSNKTNKVMYHLIACHPAKKYLPDGRNAHLIIETPNWWQEKLSSIVKWKMYNEMIDEYTAQPKKGQPIQIVKYSVTLEKNGIT